MDTEGLKEWRNNMQNMLQEVRQNLYTFIEQQKADHRREQDRNSSDHNEFRERLTILETKKQAETDLKKALWAAVFAAVASLAALGSLIVQFIRG